MQIGKLDQRIRIERPQVVTDADYGPQSGTTWVEYVTVWAQVQDVIPSKGEEQGAGMRVGVGRSRIRTRYLNGITSDMRVVQIHRGNRLLQIVTPPAELGRKDGLEFMAENFSSKASA